MKSESIAYAVAGVLFGLIAGWIIGSQQAGPPVGPGARGPGGLRASPAPPTRRRDRRCRRTSPRPIASPRTPCRACSSATCTSTPSATARRSPGTARRSSSQPNNVDVSTDLGVSYYYTNQPDRALEQFARSLALDPKHTKTHPQRGHRQGVRQAGSRRRRGGLAAGAQARPGQPRRAGGPACARQPAFGAPRRRAEAGGLMLRYILLLLLLIFIARAFWRVVEGVLGGGVRPAAIGEPAPSERPDGARPGLRHVRRAGARRHARRRPPADSLLLDELPRSVSRPHRMSTEAALRADIVEVGRRMYARGYTRQQRRQHQRAARTGSAA